MLHLSDYITTELHKECMKQMKLRLGRVRMKLSLKLLILRLNVALAIIMSAPMLWCIEYISHSSFLLI